MRVVVVTPWEPWRTSDGAVLPLHCHLHELSGRHDITVLSAGAHAAEQPVPDSARTLPEGLLVQWFGTARPSGLDYAVRRVRSEWERRPAHLLYVERRGLLEALAREAANTDLVYLAGWGTAQLAGRVAPVPAVHFAVDPWHDSWHNRRLPAWRRLADSGQRELVRRHELAAYPRAAAVVVVAEADAALLRRTVPGASVAVVPNGVAPGPEPVALPAAPVLGFHGAFETQANVDGARALVERIWPRVRAQVPDARVLLVGREPPPEVLRLAGDGVEVPGSVPVVRPELEAMAAYVAWLPSGMGLKNKVLEAMAAGRPVVANDRGASGIGAGDGVLVAADEQDAADAVVALLGDRAAAAALGLAGRQRVLDEFSWAASARRLELLWEQAAG